MERKDRGESLVRVGGSLNACGGILFAMTPFHPPWGYWTVWMGWFVLRVTKHGTWMFSCTMTKLERAKDTRWWDGPWTCQVPRSVPSRLNTELWLHCSFGRVGDPTSLNTLCAYANHYRTNSGVLLLLNVLGTLYRHSCYEISHSEWQ